MHLFNYLQNINCWFYYFTFRFDPHRRRSVSSSAESSCQTIILLQKQMKIQIILSFFGLRGASERRLKLVWVKCITILTVRTTYLFYKWVSEFFISPESEWGEFQWGGGANAADLICVTVMLLCHVNFHSRPLSNATSNNVNSITIDTFSSCSMLTS